MPETLRGAWGEAAPLASPALELDLASVAAAATAPGEGRRKRAAAHRTGGRGVSGPEGRNEQAFLTTQLHFHKMSLSSNF